MAHPLADLPGDGAAARPGVHRSSRATLGALGRAVWYAALAALSLLIAFGVGVASARMAADGALPFGRIAVGPWTANPALGSAEADPYTRAALARTGAVPLGQAEGIVFRAETDSDGAPLDASCDYTLSGRMPLARHWSLVPVPRLDAPERPTTLHSGALVREAGGTFTIALSNGVRPGNWLAIPPAGPFELVASLYDSPVTREPDLGSVSMPDIVRGTCRQPRSARATAEAG